MQKQFDRVKVILDKVPDENLYEFFRLIKETVSIRLLEYQKTIEEKSNELQSHVDKVRGM